MPMPSLKPVKAKLVEIRKQLSAERKGAKGSKKKVIQEEIDKVDMLIEVVSFALKNHNLC